MAQPPQVDFEVSDQNSYVFPAVKSGDLVVKMTKNNAGFHIGYAGPTASNSLLSVDDSTVRFGSSNAAFSLSNGQFIVASGSSDAPAITWSNDTQTGIYQPSAGAVAISSAGSNVVLFSSSNTFFTSPIGIGTSNPAYTLDVAGTANFSDLLINGSPVNVTDPDTSNVAYTASNRAFSSLPITGGTITGNLTVGGSIVPSQDVAYDLGTSNARFRDLYLSSNTIYLGTTKISHDSSNNIRFLDTNNTLRRIVVDEVQIGDHTAGGAAIRIRKDAATNNVKFFNVASNAEVEATSIGSGGAGGVSVCNVVQQVTSAVPSNGYTSNVLTVPTIITSSVASPANILYGSVVLGAHNNFSLSNTASITVSVRHNIGNSNYLVYSTPTQATMVQVDNCMNNTFDMTIKNVSGVNLVNPAVNYQIVQATTSNVTTVLASPVSIVTATSNITAYSGPTSSNKTLTIPAGIVTDPQGYPITYSIISDATGRATISGGSNLVYTHARSNAVGNIVIKARNPYVDDGTKTFTIAMTETRLNQPLSTAVTTISATHNSTGSGQSSNWTLSNTDQGLPLTYTLGTNGLGASIAGNIVTWTSAGATGTRTVTVNASFAAAIMAEAALAARAITLSVAETLTFSITKIMNAQTNVQSGTTYRMSGGALSSHTFIISNADKVYAWGRNFEGQLGRNNTTNSLVPISLSTAGSLSGKAIVAIAGGANHTIALDSTNKLHAWGYNAQGQLGNNTTTNSLVPILLNTTGSLSGKSIIAIACCAHTVALDSSGQVHTWGRNDSGQLGNNTNTNSLEPVSLSMAGSLSGKSIVAIAVGGDCTVALDSTGKLHAWGNNYYGQLGNNSTTNSWVPISLSTSGTLSGKSIVAIAGGGSHTIALDSTGVVHAWGTNSWGELGNNTTIQSNVPISLSTAGTLSGKSIVAINGGTSHTIALDSNGVVHAWGINGYGQLGNNTTTNSYSLVPISLSTSGTLSGKSIVAIAGGGSHTIALDSTNKLHAWGNNSDGQIGDGSTTTSFTPKIITINP